jgi:hypothetical protein
MHRVPHTRPAEPPGRTGSYLFLVALLVALLLALGLAACAGSTSGDQGTVEGRWHRLGQPQLDDPLQTLAGEHIQFGPQGMLASLLYDGSVDRFWTTMTGTYSVSEGDQITVHGTCWQGWRSFDCSGTYRVSLQGDRLTLSDLANPQRRVEYERVGEAGDAVPPGLAPPGPSATPGG